ncbi:MAG: pentapeptide repeat-containing protein [Planctomycetes bacterium]|nr:pentapeptide repeat-containing protein [Planctomycetota bacterium]
MNNGDDPVPSPERRVAFGDVLFGYDSLLHGAQGIVGLVGDEVPPLRIGMRVGLCGDSRGYVGGGFSDSEEVEIVGFREPFRGDVSDDIIEVSDGNHRTWLKPSRIKTPAPAEPQPALAAPRQLEAGAQNDLEAGSLDFDPDHLKRLAGGVKSWNAWRAANPDVRPRLASADLREFDLREIDLHAADLRGIEGYGIDLYEADLRGADFRRAFLQAARFARADLCECDLRGASLSNTELIAANLQRALLRDATLLDADLSGANLSGADLTDAYLDQARLYDVDLSNATLERTRLMGAILVRVMLQGARLSDCRVHAASVWKIATDANTRQTNIIVTDFPDPTVTADSIEVAQLIHLLIDTNAMGQVIESMSGKAVLLLGRFSPERLPVLEAIAEHLRAFDELPIIFNFDKPRHRSLGETVRILAGLSKYVIADLTDPRSAPLESQLIIPDLAVPFFPIIEAGQTPFAMFEGLADHGWLLPGLKYRDVDHLIGNLPRLRDEALRKRDDVRAAREQRRPLEFRDELPPSESSWL